MERVKKKAKWKSRQKSTKTERYKNVYFLDRINNRLDTTKERINEPEGNAIKIIQIEAHEQKIDLKKWNTLNNL